MFSSGGLLIPPSCPMNLFQGGSRTPSVLAGLRGPRPRPRRPPPLASICLFRSGGSRPVSYLCVSRGASRVPSPTRAFWEGGVMSVTVCYVFPPLVSIFGLFPVLGKCDYQFILIQRCLSHYLCLSYVFYSLVCSV